MIVGAATIHIAVTASDWGAVLPELVLTAGVLVMLLLDISPVPNKTTTLTYVALLTVAIALVVSYNLFNHGATLAMYGTVTSDRFAIFFNYVILLSAALAILLSPSYIDTSAFDPGEYYALVLAACAGMMLLAAANSFMTLFIGLEILSLALYILSGFDRRSERSQESGFKYFLLSSFASAFLIYGMALVYGATGSTRLSGVVKATGIAGTSVHACVRGVGCPATASLSPLLYVGIALMVVGFAFKVSIVPFHMWTPDVYEGAPTPVTAFMSVATKAAMFAAFVRVFNLTFASLASHWYYIMAALAIATMIVGNVIALTQTNMKRMLAYSGIAHAGYILVALAANSRQGMTAVLFYFLAYTFMNIGAFIIVAVLESNGQVGDEISTYRGLWRRNPALAGFTAVFMFSLAGFPPSAGFFAKYLAFLAIVQSGHTELAVIGVLTSLISIFYYLRVVIVMFMQPEGAEAREAPIHGMTDVAMAAAVAGSIGLGLIPTGFYTLAGQAVTAVRAAYGLG